MGNFESFSEFTVSSVMGRIWSVMREKPAVFIGLELISLITAALGNIAVTALVMIIDGGGADAFWAALPFMLRLDWDRLMNSGGSAFSSAKFAMPFAMAAYMIIITIFQGAITYAVFQVLMRGRASVWEAFKRSLPRVPSLFLGTLIIVLVAIVCVVKSVLLVTFLGVVGAIIGLSITAVVLAVVLVMWCVFAPACVLERLSSPGSLFRSARLTKGYRWRIFGIVVPILVLRIVLGVVVQFVGIHGLGGGVLASLFALAAQLLPDTYASLIPPVIYYSLRVSKEGLTPESLADIFD